MSFEEPGETHLRPDSSVLRLPYRGERTYVHSTDLMTEMQNRFPDSEIDLQFIRPVRSPASLVETASGKSAFAKTLACRVEIVKPDGARRTLLIVNDRAEDPVHLPQISRTPARVWRLGHWMFFYFSVRGEPSHQISELFENIQARQGRRYLVRRMTQHRYRGEANSIVCVHVRCRADGQVLECRMFRGLRPWLTIRAAARTA